LFPLPRWRKRCHGAHRRPTADRAFEAAVIVDNKPGGNGAIGSDSVAKAPADGYTILLGYIATHGINPALSKLPYDAVKDFAPIGQIAEAQMALVVHPSLPVKTSRN
jgi:tripartite-type tricarboxylate transporter receptor subunit TctC